MVIKICILASVEELQHLQDSSPFMVRFLAPFIGGNAQW